MRQYGESTDTILVDALLAPTLPEFAREFAGALSKGDREREGIVAQQSIAGIDDSSAWSSLVLEWSSRDRDELIVLENLENLFNSADAIGFLSRLFARMGRGTRLAVCSRRPLPFLWNRFIAPHECVRLGVEDLRFTQPEISEVFASQALSARTAEVIFERTRGWPIAVFMLQRLSRERSLEEVLESVRGIEDEDLYDYLADQVLASMPSERVDILLAAAAIPRAKASEVAFGVGAESVNAELDDLARGSGFLYATGDSVYEVHPLVRSMLLQRYVARARETLLHAARRIGDSQPLRAAELYLAAGEESAAADLLEDIPETFTSDLAPELAEVIAKLGVEVFSRRPGLWQAAVPVRVTAITHGQWLHEALVARENLEASTPIRVRLGVLASLGNVLSNLGRHEEALAIYSRFHDPEIPAEQTVVAEFFEASIEARRGRFRSAMQLWCDVEPKLKMAKYTLALGIEEVPVRAARFLGDRVEERALLERAMALARDSRNAITIALTLEEAAFAAWLAGEEATYDRYVRELEAAVAPNTVRGTEVFRASTRGDHDSVLRSEGYEHPKMRAYASLIACSGARGTDRARLAEFALKAAMEGGEPMTAALACIACAECLTAERAKFAARAIEFAEQCESGELQQSVKAYAEGKNARFLAPLVDRLRSGPLPGTALQVAVSAASVRRAGVELSMPLRELQLVLFLACSQRGVLSGELADALWPDSDSGKASLRVYVSRVRDRLGENALVLDRGRYVLGPNVAVDLRDAEQALLVARRESPLSPKLRAQLTERARELLASGPSLADTWEWFAPVRLRINDLAREIGMLLGRDALRTGDIEGALSFGRQITSTDPFDEPARELIVRAHLAADDRVEALHEYRRYRDLLERELSTRPSAAFADLIGTAVTDL